jgi:hypothetical protein
LIINGSLFSTTGELTDDLNGVSDTSSVEQASKIGIPRAVRTKGLHAVFRNSLLFFITIFCLKINKNN